MSVILFPDLSLRALKMSPSKKMFFFFLQVNCSYFVTVSDCSESQELLFIVRIRLIRQAPLPTSVKHNFALHCRPCFKFIAKSKRLIFCGPGGRRDEPRANGVKQWVGEGENEA